MSRRIEELGFRATPMGEISLRRRREPSLDVDVYEVRLGDAFLMSSLFPVAEIELARLGLAATDAPELNVVVGGLGLGYTARTALDDTRVQSLQVIEALDVVIEWHQQGLLPDAAGLASDPRCRLVLGDFFELVATGQGFGEPVDAVLLDVDHTPRHVLHPSHAPFYEEQGLRRLAGLLHPGGVFALWSDDPPDEGFLAVLEEVFANAVAHVVTFPNHLTAGTSANTVYVATTHT